MGIVASWCVVMKCFETAGASRLGNVVRQGRSALVATDVDKLGPANRKLRTAS
jgi:hypothetical protein